MYKIYYHTHAGNEKIKTAFLLSGVATILENLYKARIKATAWQGRTMIGAVDTFGGQLSWHCEEKVTQPALKSP